MTDERQALYRIVSEIRAVWLLDRSPRDAIAAIDMILVDAIAERPRGDGEGMGRPPGCGLIH